MFQADFCQGLHEPFNQTNSVREDPAFDAGFIKKFCTMTGAVDPFMLYFPYFLLIVALILVCIERFFLKIFKAGSKLDKFYSLLVRENVLDAKSKMSEGVVDAVDHGKEAVKIRQSFKGSNGYFLSYVLRTVMEVAVAGLLLFYMIWRGIPILSTDEVVVCNVHGFFYECAGQPADFYAYILYVTCVITLLYILCNCYNFLWLTVPCFGKLSRVMAAYR